MSHCLINGKFAPESTRTNHNVSTALSLLRDAVTAGDVTASFRKLNPQAGGDVPRPTEAHFVCGPQTEVEQQESTEWQRGVGLEPDDPTAPTWKRRPLQPPRGTTGSSVLLLGGSAEACAPHQQVLGRWALGLQLQDNASVVQQIRLPR